MSFWHELSNFFGVTNEAGPGYGFWSGVGSDIGEVAIIGAIVAAYRRHNCHVKGCWRIQRHQVEGTPYIVCRKHHPSTGHTAPTAHQVHFAWGKANQAGIVLPPGWELMDGRAVPRTDEAVQKEFDRHREQRARDVAKQKGQKKR